MTCWRCQGVFETNVEERMCKNGPCQSCVDVEKVNQEIKQTMTILQRLIAKRRDLRSEQNRAHDPMHRLPVELKNYIFRLLLPSHDEWGKTLTIMPSYLASVCREWRDIALSNPFLWSTISTVMLQSTPDPSNFIHDWILRSQTLPLTFHFQVLDDTRGVQARSEKVLADVMGQLECSNRIQSLSLDVPFATLRSFQGDFQWHRLTQLRIVLPEGQYDLSLFNATASPEKIELEFLSFESLQISWNRLLSAKLRWIRLEDVVLLFQHALQMTHCHIGYTYDGENLLIPPILHPRLETLSLRGDGTNALLGSLTLPCLQEFNANRMVLLTHLPALVQRSSCPLTRLTLFEDLETPHLAHFDNLQALSGVVDLVVDDIVRRHQAPLIKKFLLEGYLPDLRQVTLRLEPFLLLWDMGVIPVYLDRKWPRPDGPSEGRLHKLLVVDPGYAGAFEAMWNSDVGEQVKALGIGLREGGFEFL